MTYYINDQLVVQAGTSTSGLDFIVARPTNFGSGSPQIALNKSGTAATWNIALWDGSALGGTVNFLSSALTFNGIPVAVNKSNPYTQSAFFDGNHHPLSGVSTFQGQNTSGSTLAQWQAIFPKANALSDELDGLCVQRDLDLHPNGIMIVIPGFGYSSYEITTNGPQNVNYEGVGRDLCGITFLNVGGYGLTHGRTTAASGTFKATDMSIFCQGGAFAAGHVATFNTQQPAWCHTLERVAIEGVNGNNEWWANACIIRDVGRGLSWKDVVAVGHDFYVLPTNAFELQSDIASDSYNFDNCLAVGYYFAWNAQFAGDSSIAAHRLEEMQFYNCQAYSGVGLLQVNDTNVNAPPSDNYTLIACGWQGTGPCFNLSHVQQVFVHDCLFVNNPTTAANHTTIASIVNCNDVEFSCNEYFSVDSFSNYFNFFYIEGSATRYVRFDRNYFTNLNSFDEVIYIASDVPPRSVFEQRTLFYTTHEPNTAYVVDASNAQASELRAVKALSAAIAAGHTSSLATVTMDNQGVLTLTDSFTQTTGDAYGNMNYYYPAGLFRASPASIVVCNGNASFTTSYPIANVGNNGGVTIRWPAITVAGTSVTTNITVVGSI